MSTSTINAEADLTTLINVFTVEPALQRQLVDLLDQATEQVMRYQPGFISANIHASADGTQVVNYAQWESEGAFRTMLTNPAAREHMAATVAIATAQPLLYTVTSVHHR